MNKALDNYCRVLDAVIALLLAIMVVLVFGNVVLRYAFNSGIMVSEEVSRWMFVWITFLGATVAVRRHAHLGTDVLVSRLPVKGRRACLVIGQVLMLWVTWLLFSGSLEQARINSDSTAPVTGLPVSIVYAAGLVFAVSTSVFLLVELYHVLRGDLRQEDLVMVSTEDAKIVAHDAAAPDAGPLDKR